MAKKESTLGNMLFTLFIITFIASSALGAVYTLTKKPIEAAMLAKTNNAIMEVIPEFDNNPSEEVFKMAVDGDTLYFFPGKNKGELVGTAVETFTKSGFSGEIRIMVGLLPDGTINDVAVLKHEETPGLGDKIEKKKDDWSNKFKGLHPEATKIAVKADGGDIDAITASTITSRAFCEAVVRAYDTYMKNSNNN